MIRSLLSADYPRSRLVAAMLLAIVVLLALVPFVFPGARSMSVAAKILVFILLVASYDLLLGYTGIVSFAHTMFFGIGAYGVAIASSRLDATWGALAIGVGSALLLSALLALVIGLFSLRVKAIFFAMITLAVASAFQTLASQLSEITGGEDGLSFKVPRMLRPAFEPFENPVFGLDIDGRIITYYLLFFAVLVLFLMLLRIVNSPFGRVLQAIRENDFRAEAIGYRTVVFRTVSNVLAALFATLAGALLALWLRYNGPDTSLSFEIMLDTLLIVVIGGMGTMYGAVIGSALFVFAQSYLQDFMGWISGSLEAVPLLAALFSPDRWLLWLGLLFVLSVYHFPTGIVGRLRARALERQRAAGMNSSTSDGAAPAARAGAER
jgi:branched-chain amino acid transport system permease protein